MGCGFFSRILEIHVKRIFCPDFIKRVENLTVDKYIANPLFYRFFLFRGNIFQNLIFFFEDLVSNKNISFGWKKFLSFFVKNIFPNSG